MQQHSESTHNSTTVDSQLTLDATVSFTSQLHICCTEYEARPLSASVRDALTMRDTRVPILRLHYTAHSQCNSPAAATVSSTTVASTCRQIGCMTTSLVMIVLHFKGAASIQLTRIILSVVTQFDMSRRAKQCDFIGVSLLFTSCNQSRIKSTDAMLKKTAAFSSS